jgi:hypothetical protein
MSGTFNSALAVIRDRGGRSLGLNIGVRDPDNNFTAE